MKPSEIITDEQARIVHANANFGDATPREIINDTITKYALGFDSGHTAWTIVHEHGLTLKSEGPYSVPRISKKGFRYLRALYGGNFDKLKHLRCTG